jgi:hypothetical protein
MRDLQSIIYNNKEGEYNEKFLASRLLKNPKHKMIDEFWKRINIDQERDGRKPYKKSLIAFKVSHLEEDDMAFLLKKCQQANNFGRCFFGLLKKK